MFIYMRDKTKKLGVPPSVVKIRMYIYAFKKYVWESDYDEAIFLSVLDETA